MRTKCSSSSKVHRFDLVGFAIASGLAISHLLLPLERGAPLVRVASYSLTIGTVAVLAAFVILAFRSAGRLLFAHVDYYIICQAALIWVFIVTLPFADRVTTAIGFILHYMAAFVMPYMIWRYYFLTGRREMVDRVFASTAVCAALVGWVAFFFGKYLPFYTAMFNRNYSQDMATRIAFSGGGGFRGFGTMGNPVVYGVLLALAIPLGSEIKRRWLRICYWLVVGGMAIVAVSTTALVMVGVIFLGRALYARQWHVRVSAILVITCLLVLMTFGGARQLPVLSGPWGTLDLTRILMGNSGNIAARLVAWRTLLAQVGNGGPWAVLMGHGIGTAPGVLSGLSYSGKQIGAINTSDNAYLNLLYENGLLGLLVYVAALVGMLVRYRRAAHDSLYWWAIFAFAMAGMSFVTYAYMTIAMLFSLNLAGLVSSENRLSPGISNPLAQEDC